MNPENRSPLPGMAFTGYATRYREPSMDEGFQDITQVDFHFSGTDDEKALWGRYWI
jgi:bifunctional polynucleotide phosphatase/kinase